MKKLAVVLALAVSGFVNAQNPKLDSSIIYNTIKTYENFHSIEFDSIMSLNIDEDTKISKIQEFINIRYKDILGSRYKFNCFTITNNNDIFIEIENIEYYNPNNPNSYRIDKIGSIFTNLSNIEESSRLNLLMNEIEYFFYFTTTKE